MVDDAPNATKLIKHPPPRLRSDIGQGLIYVSSSTPYVSVVKRVKKQLATTKSSKPVTVYALGKAIDQAVNVGFEFQNLHHRVEITTDTVAVLDEEIPDPNAISLTPAPIAPDTLTTRRRNVSKIQIHIFPRQE